MSKAHFCKQNCRNGVPATPEGATFAHKIEDFVSKSDRLSNPYEGKKVKAFAKEKVWVLGSRVQSTLNAVHSTIARARSSVCRTRPFAFAEQKHPERTSNFRLLVLSKAEQEAEHAKVCGV